MRILYGQMVLMLALLLPVHALADNATVLVYPRVVADSMGKADHYALDVLTAALERAPHRYRLVPSRLTMNQGRAINSLESGGEIHVLWTVSSAERERRLLPVRFPIDRGLMGWRLLLVKQADLPRFAAVRNQRDLAALTAVQGHDWPDTDVLRSNGFKVHAVSARQSLHAMLGTARIDYFPRALDEAVTEALSHKAAGLVIEPNLVLHYPAAYYFFTNRGRPELAADIAAGLAAISADGTLDRIFQAGYGDALRQAQVRKRLKIELNNPLLPQETPLHDTTLWLLP